MSSSSAHVWPRKQAAGRKQGQGRVLKMDPGPFPAQAGSASAGRLQVLTLLSRSTPRSTAIGWDKLSPTKEGPATAPKAFTRSHRVNAWIRLAHLGRRRGPPFHCRVKRSQVPVAWSRNRSMAPPAETENILTTQVVRNQERAHAVFFFRGRRKSMNEMVRQSWRCLLFCCSGMDGKNDGRICLGGSSHMTTLTLFFVAPSTCLALSGESGRIPLRQKL